MSRLWLPFVLLSFNTFAADHVADVGEAKTLSLAQKICRGEERFFEVPAPDQSQSVLGTRLKLQAVDVDHVFTARLLVT